MSGVDLYHIVGCAGPDAGDGWIIEDTWTEYEIDGWPEDFEEAKKKVAAKEEWDYIRVVVTTVDYETLMDALSETTSIGEAELEADDGE